MPCSLFLSVFPLMTQHALLSANISRTFTQHIKVVFWDTGGTGSTKLKNAEKFLNSLWKKILDYFRSINCTTVSIHGCNCCRTGIELSKCVYLASMAVKIEHTVEGHNHVILQQYSSDVYASQVLGLNQSKTCQIYAFVHRSSFACTENYIKINFVVFSVIFFH